MGSVTRLIVIALIVVHFEVIHNGPRSLVRSGKHATARLHGMLNRRRGQVLSWTDRAARELARQLLRGGDRRSHRQRVAGLLESVATIDQALRSTAIGFV